MHATDDPYLASNPPDAVEEQLEISLDELEPLRRNLSELQTDDEGFFESKPTTETIELAKVPAVP